MPNFKRGVDTEQGFRVDGSVKIYTSEALPDPASLPVGTPVVVATQYGKNIATVVNGVLRYLMPFVTTWSGRPPASSVPVGTELQVTDYGNQKWVSNGTYWRPAQGRVTIAQHWGSYEKPLATLQTVATGQFTIPGGNPLIPAGMIVPHSSVRCFATIRKVGGNAGVRFDVRIGTSGNISDSLFASFNSTTPTTGLDVQHAAAARFGGEANRLAALRYIGDGHTTAYIGSGIDLTVNVNTAMDMKVSFSIGVGHVSDVYNLIGYNIWLEV